MIQTVTSVQNPRIRALRDLRQSKTRHATGVFLVEGYKLCEEALRFGQVKTLLVDESKQDTYASLINRASDTLIAPEHVVASVCDAKTPQGIAASVQIPFPLDLDHARDALLVLDGVQDPGNVGTMIRTAEAAGMSAVLLSPACADAFAPKTVRASMGSMLRMPLWRGALPEAISHLQRKGFAIASSQLGGKSFYDALPGLNIPLALIIGSEGQGVSSEVSALSDLHIALPMHGNAESLNAAVAAGILMYGIMEHLHAN